MKCLDMKNGKIIKKVADYSDIFMFCARKDIK